MSQRQNDMSGVLFKNDRKTESKHPDYKGQGTVGGVEMWISAWIKEGQKGKFMSLSFTRKDEKSTPRRPGKDEDDDSSVPF